MAGLRHYGLTPCPRLHHRYNRYNRRPGAWVWSVFAVATFAVAWMALR